MTKKRYLFTIAVVSIPLLLLFGLFIGVYNNQRALTQKAIDKINTQFTGRLLVGDSRVAMFVQFPYISIDLQDIVFYGDKGMNTAPIYAAEDIYLGFNAWEIVWGNFEVKRISVKNGKLNLIKYTNGEINLLVAKNVETTSDDEDTGESLAFNLAELNLRNFELSLEDQTMDQELVASVHELTASFSLTDDQILLGVKSGFRLDVFSGGEPTFFADKSVDIDLEMNFDRSKQLLQVLPSRLGLGESLFTLEGEAFLSDSSFLDLKLYGEKPDFNLFTAFAPKEVADALNKYQNDGEIYFLGTIKGSAGNGNMPAIAVEFGCENASFVNTDKDKRIDDLRFSGFFTNGKERSLKTSEFRLTNFYAKPDKGIFEGQLIIRDFEDPYIKVGLNADIDLEFLGQFFELQGLEQLQGKIQFAIDFDELVQFDTPTEGLSHLKKGLDSELTVKELSFVIPGYPIPVTNATVHAVMKDGDIALNLLRFDVGTSAFSFTGRLTDFPAVFHKREDDVSLVLEAKSDKIAIGELLAYDSVLARSLDEEISQFSLKVSFDTKASSFTASSYLPTGDLKIENFSARLKRYPHLLHDVEAFVQIAEDQIAIRDFKAQIDGSDFRFSGRIHNYVTWFQDVQKGDTSFEFDFRSDLLKVRDLLTYNGENYLPDDYRDEVLSGVVAKGSLDLHYDSLLHSADLMVEALEGKMRMHPLALEDFSGSIHFEQGNVLVEKFGGKMGQSSFEIDMSYFVGDDLDLKVRDNQLALRADALDLDALLNYQPNEDSAVAHADTFNIFDLPFSDMRFMADIGRLNYHTYWLEHVKGEMRTTEDHFLHLDTLHFNLAGGSLGMQGYFNGSDPTHIYFNSTMIAQDLDIDKLMIKFDNFGQDVMINENLHGKVSGTIKSNFLVHPDLTPIVEKSNASMDLTVTQGSLVNFTPLEAVSSYFKDKNLQMVRFDTLQNTFELKEGVLTIPSMNINSSLGFIELSGRQTLDLKMDYFIRIPLGLVTQVGFRSLFAGKGKEEIDPEQEDAIVYRDQDRRIRFVNLNISGDPDNFTVSLGKDKRDAPE